MNDANDNNDGLDETIPFVQMGDIKVRRDYSKISKTPMGLTFESAVGEDFHFFVNEEGAKAIARLVLGQNFKP